MKKRLLNRKRLMQLALSLCLILMSANSSLGQGVTQTIPGTYSYTVPAGVTSIKLESWGAGGAGGSAQTATIGLNTRGGGGAGGSYASTTISVTTGEVITYTVGAGGTAQTTGFTNLAAGGEGGFSSASIGNTVVVKALGGLGGQSALSAATTTVNGAGGTAYTTGNTGSSFWGGNGGAAATGYSGSGGGSAGTASNGNNGALLVGGIVVTGGGAGGNGSNTNNALTAGSVGSSPGGGGAGGLIRGSSISGFAAGGIGGNGKVVISYPIITKTGTFSSLSTVAGTASGSTSIGVTGADMQSAITATASAGFEVSSDNTTFSSFITSTTTSGSISFPTVYVRLAASATEGFYASGTVTFTGTNAATVIATIPSSTVSSASAAGITVSTTSLSTSFAKTTAGTNSTASQNFMVSGVNLGTDAITIAAPTHFKISLTDVDANYSSSNIVLTPSSGTVGTTPIYVKYSPTGTGNISGNSDSISITNASLATQTVSVTGSGLNAFYYNSGSLATIGSWKALSNGSGDSPADFTTAGITYTILTNATTDASWSVSGASSKIVVGNGSAVTLTVADTFPITGTIDAAANGSVVWQHILASPTFGTLNSTSEVHFQPAAAASYSPSATTFGKLFIDSPYSGSVNLSNVQTVATSLSVVAGSILILPTQATHVIYINSGATVTIDGTVRSIKKTGIFSFNNTTANITNTGTAIQFKDSGSTLTLSATSTIDYSSINGTQTISSLPSGISYANLTLSENSTNITSSSIKAFPTLIITGTLTINTPGNVTYASSTTGADFITLGNGATIVRTLGTLNAAPLYSGTYNVTYNGKLTTAAAANTTTASTTVTLTSANETIVAGMNVTGTAVAAGTTVASISGTSLVLSQNATLTATAVTLTFQKAIAQTQGVELPNAANVLNNLTIDNPAGVILNLDTTVNNDLTLGFGSALTIPTGKNLTVDNAIVNNGTITIENNANLVQTAVANNNSGSGTAIVKRNSASIQLYDYTLWSSPVTGQNLKAFSPETLDSRFYNYNSSTNQYNVVPNPTTTPFAPATGYLIRAPNTLAPATLYTFNGVFTGVPNNGNISLSASALASDKFYAVGNPYPSTISADLFLNGNATGGTLYFWRKINNATTTPTTSYATYTLAGGVGTGIPNSGGSSSITPDGTIQVGQGFIVKTGASSTALNFTNAMRTSSNTSPFLRTTEDRSRFWLNLTSTTGAFCQTMVAYMPEATSGLDTAIDGRYFNDSPIALTSIINNEEYTIQGRAMPFSTSDSVPLSFKTDAAGNYTIAIDHVDGLFSSGQAIYLKDNLLNTVNNLSAGTYSFASAIGTFNSRFEIVYQNLLGVNNPEFTSSNIVAFNDNGDIRINSGSTIMELVRLYDLQGRLLVEKKQINSSETKLSTTATNQVLLLEITAANGTKVTKKIIQ